MMVKKLKHVKDKSMNKLYDNNHFTIMQSNQTLQNQSITYVLKIPIESNNIQIKASKDSYNEMHT